MIPDKLVEMVCVLFMEREVCKESKVFIFIGLFHFEISIHIGAEMHDGHSKWTCRIER